MSRIIFSSALLFCFIWVGAQKQSEAVFRRPIKLDVRALSGLDLKRVQNQDDPDRILHQKRLLWGDDLGVFVVSSETKAVHWDGYGIEEFIYVINGRARLNPDDGEERFYDPGEFFVAPLGYEGEWETQGAKAYYYELSIIATDRSDTTVNNNQIAPFDFSSELLSGVHLPDTLPIDGFVQTCYVGPQLTVELIAENPSEKTIQFDEDALIYVLSGALSLEYEEEEVDRYYTRDFLIIPNGFKGLWSTEGHDIFRYIKVTSTN